MTLVTATIDGNRAVLTWYPDKPDQLRIWVPGHGGFMPVPAEVVSSALITAMRATAHDGQPRRVGALMVERSAEHGRI